MMRTLSIRNEMQSLDSVGALLDFVWFNEKYWNSFAAVSRWKCDRQKVGDPSPVQGKNIWKICIIGMASPVCSQPSLRQDERQNHSRLGPLCLCFYSLCRLFGWFACQFQSYLRDWKVWLQSFLKIIDRFDSLHKVTKMTKVNSF